MIFRRLPEAIKGQNWSTAVLEILIVVIGIFIGLQANDWNSARLDRSLEMRYLERIQTDLQSDLGVFDRSAGIANRRMRQVELLLDSIADPEIAASHPNQFIEAVEKAGWDSYRRITTGAYSELVNMGRTTLIRSVVLRGTLAEYYARIDFWEGVKNQDSVTHEFTIASAGVLSKDYLAAIEGGTQNDDVTDLGASAEEAISIAEHFKSRTQAARLLPQIYQSHMMVRNAVAEHRERNAAVQIVIDDYLESGTDDL